jgi:hypothetical protein
MDSVSGIRSHEHLWVDGWMDADADARAQLPTVE